MIMTYRLDELEKYLDKRRQKLRQEWNLNQDDIEIESRLDEVLKILDKIDKLKGKYMP